MATNIFLFVIFILICGIFIYAAIKVVLNLCRAINARNKKWIINSIILLLIEAALLAFLVPRHLDSGIDLFHKILN